MTYDQMDDEFFKCLCSGSWHLLGQSLADWDGMYCAGGEL